MGRSKLRKDFESTNECKCMGEMYVLKIFVVMKKCVDVTSASHNR